MSSGSFSVDAPHICGETIRVEIRWAEDPGVRTYPNGDPGYPPSWDEEWIYTHERMDYDIARCPKCGVDLELDSIFQNTVVDLAKDKYDDPADDLPDYEPEDYEPELYVPDFEEPDDTSENRDNWEAEEQYRKENE